ncbi:MAG: hypothetical protein NTV01_22710, partial [Bacteroidia bacterium]|nr:hypothetical protein [Bacteroidia bacterium]
METSENNLNSNDSMVISSEIRHYLLETAKWMKFLAILGFIGLGFMLVAAIVMLVLGSTFESLPAVR